MVVTSLRAISVEKLPPGKPPEVDARALILAHVDPNLGGLELPEVGVLDRVEVLEQPVQQKRLELLEQRPVVRHVSTLTMRRTSG